MPGEHEREIPRGAAPAGERPFIHPITGAVIPGFLSGIIAPMFSPVRHDGSLDGAGFRAYAEYLCRQPGVSTLFGRAGVGGMFTYSAEEARLVTELVADVALRHGKPFIIGCPGTWPGWPSAPAPRESYLDESIEFGRLALDRGASAAVLPLPYGLLDPAAGGGDAHDVYLDYFSRAAAAIPGRVVIYHVPQAAQHQWCPPATLRALLERHDNIVGIKVSHPDMIHQTQLLMQAVGSNFAFIAGCEQLFLPVLLLGGSGVIGEGCSRTPEIFREILDAFVAGRLADARAAQFAVVEALAIGWGLGPGRSAARNYYAADAAGLAYLAYKAVYPFGPRLRCGTEWPSPIEQERMGQAIDRLRSPYLEKLARRA